MVSTIHVDAIHIWAVSAPSLLKQEWHKHFLTGTKPLQVHLDALAVDHRYCRTGFATSLFQVEHQFNVINGLEQEASRQLTKAAMDRATVPRMDRQHPPIPA